MPQYVKNFAQGASRPGCSGSIIDTMKPIKFRGVTIRQFLREKELEENAGMLKRRRKSITLPKILFGVRPFKTDAERFLNWKASQAKGN